MAENKNPDYKNRAGAIQVAVWENKTDKGTFHNVSATRSYKDGEDWKQTTVTLNMREVPDMIACLQTAYNTIRVKNE